MQPSELEIAKAVQSACLEAARDGYEQAALAGLCHEGAMEASLDAIRALKPDRLLAALGAGKNSGPADSGTAD